MIKNIADGQKKTLVIIVLAVVLLYIDIAVIFKLQLASFRKFSSEVRRKRAGFIQFKKDSSDPQRIFDEFNYWDTKYRNIQGLLIPDSDLSVLLGNISQKANSFGIKIMQARPIREGMAEEKNIPSTQLFKIYSIPVDLELISGYHQLGRFLSSLEDNPMVSVTNVIIKSNSADPLHHTVGVSLKAYVTRK